MQIERGTVFGHRYVVQSQIGTGGMAVVYRGMDQTLDRLVAIKVMLERYAQDPSFAARFKQEAQAAAALQSPYIVSVHDWGREGDTYYIVMEYLRGTDLKTGIRSHGALAPRKVAQIGAQVCQALSVAHAHEIIHRDIKPQNIMIQPNGDAKVMDFGIARSKNSHLTQTNSVLGTAHYVSPEQAQGKELGPTSDLYSLGVVMYEASTGKLPFDGDDAVSVALKQVSEEPVPPSEVNPNVDDQLDAIIMKCMMKNPAERFQSADELRRVLNAYIMGRPFTLGGTTTVLRPGSGVGAGTTTALPGPGATEKTRPMVRAVGVQPLISPTQPADPRVSAPQERQRGGSGKAGGGARRAAVAIVAAILVVALAVVLIPRLGSCSPSPDADASKDAQTEADKSTKTQVEVPSLSGKTVSQASSALSGVGLTLGSQTTQPSDAVPKGQIISQTPAAGSSAASGTAVSVVVSSGAQNATLPTSTELRGMTENEATQKLTAAGVTPIHEASLDDYADDVEKGRFLVLDPSLANRTSLAKGTKVKYGLSKGAATTVPGVEGTYYTDAEATLSSLGLVFWENWVDDDNSTAGTVLYADPASGSRVDPGSTVTLTISNGPQQVEVPAITGASQEAATAALAAAGLNWNVSGNYSSTVPAGSVISASPGDGSKVAKGSTVNLVVSNGVDPNTQNNNPAPDNNAGGDNQNGGGQGGGEQGGGQGGAQPDNPGNTDQGGAEQGEDTPDSGGAGTDADPGTTQTNPTNNN